MPRSNPRAIEPNFFEKIRPVRLTNAEFGAGRFSSPAGARGGPKSLMGTHVGRTRSKRVTDGVSSRGRPRLRIRMNTNAASRTLGSARRTAAPAGPEGEGQEQSPRFRSLGSWISPSRASKPLLPQQTWIFTKIGTRVSRRGVAGRRTTPRVWRRARKSRHSDDSESRKRLYF